MRDDIRKFFSAYLVLQKKKLQRLTEINTTQPQKRYLLRAEDIEQLIDLNARDSSLMAEIDVMDFELAALRKKICEAAGIVQSRFDEYIDGSNDETLLETVRIQHDIEKLFKELQSENALLTAELENKLKSTGEDLKSLERVIKVSRMIGKGKTG